MGWELHCFSSHVDVKKHRLKWDRVVDDKFPIYMACIIYFGFHATTGVMRVTLPGIKEEMVSLYYIVSGGGKIENICVEIY